MKNLLALPQPPHHCDERERREDDTRRCPSRAGGLGQFEMLSQTHA
jgi:hypothetical protein